MSTTASDAAPAPSTSPVGAASYLVELREAATPAPPEEKPVDGARIYAAMREATLSAADRDALPDSDFAIPGKREYPIQDKGHAKAALSMAGGKPEEATVRAAVFKRYPELKPKDE